MVKMRDPVSQEHERWQVRRWIESAMRALEQKDYDHAWTCCNQAMHYMTQCELRNSENDGGRNRG